MTPRYFKRVMIVGLFLATFALIISTAQNDSDVDTRYVGLAPAPQFPTGLDWLNVEHPLTLEGLRGKIILLDFWTYGCINCIHMIPVLEALEAKYSEELVIIGVHSAKFDNEGETENIRQIVQRYNVHHPVINDSDFRVWRQYNIRAWPSFVIIDPRGNVVAMQAGEIPFESFDQYLNGMIAYYDGLGTDEIDRTPLALALEGAGDPGTPLLFPGAVLVDAEGGRLFITDTNHHRIVIADIANYEVLATIGSGRRGFDDGDFDTATFFQPQGLALDSDNQMLYVADTNNHAIRAVNLTQGRVDTIAGTGEMGRTVSRFGTVYQTPRQTNLRSPWDVALDGAGNLHIAMAGNHQLWMMDLERRVLSVSVGNGREAQINRTLADSELAQPSFLFYQGDGLLYFADSESSTVRLADFNADAVRVIAGTTENSLFDFGDVDGVLGVNRLQHALGVTGSADGERIYITDTYNNRIKLYRAEDETTVSLFGTGEAGLMDGDATTARFHEPSGIDYHDGRLYVADTNNHAIRIIDLQAGVVSTLTFPNPQALAIDPDALIIVGGNTSAPDRVTLPPQTIAQGAGTLTLELILPDGYKINPLIQSSATLSGDVMAWQASEGDVVFFDEARMVFDVQFASEGGDVTLDLLLYYCEAENEAFCLVDDVTYSLPLQIDAQGDDALTIERTITPPEIYRSGF